MLEKMMGKMDNPLSISVDKIYTKSNHMAVKEFKNVPLVKYI